MSPSLDNQAQGPIAFLRTAQIVAGSLIMGVSIFLVVVFLVRSGKGGFAENPWDFMGPKSIPTLIGLFMAATLMVLSFLVPRQLVANHRKCVAAAKRAEGAELIADEMGLFGFYQAQMIVGMALLEGAAFFNVGVFLVAGHILNLIAVIGLVLLIVIRFPTEGRVEAWIDNQMELIRQERDFA